VILLYLSGFFRASFRSDTNVYSVFFSCAVYSIVKCAGDIGGRRLALRLIMISFIASLIPKEYVIDKRHVWQLRVNKM